ncbi:MAG: response regulator transcription factor [Actinomycetota bacterium]
MPPSGKPQPIRVLIVDDQRTFGEALQFALGREKDLTIVDVVTDGSAAVEAVSELKPDVVLMDVALPGMNGIEATRRIKDAEPGARVLILSGYEDELLLARAVQAGASGLLRKTKAVVDVGEAVRQVHRGEPLHERHEIEGALRRLRHRRDQDATSEGRLSRLTPRELQILQQMAAGKAPDRIAEDLGVSPNTLRTHTQNIITKLGVHSKLEALVLAIRHNKVVTVDVTDGEDR